MKMGIKIKFGRLIFIAFVVYLLLAKKTLVLRYELFLRGQSPKEVWAFLADFSNVARMNKRISQWRFVGDENVAADEKGNLVWTYAVVSHEAMFGQSVFGPNENHGNITASEVRKLQHYRITENYLTFSFRRMIAIENWTEMDFFEGEKEGKYGTIFTENVSMNCPLIFTKICVHETDRNREDFFEHLKRELVRQ